jgi:hypothetical protein
MKTLKKGINKRRKRKFPSIAVVLYSSVELPGGSGRKSTVEKVSVRCNYWMIPWRMVSPAICVSLLLNNIWRHFPFRTFVHRIPICSWIYVCGYPLRLRPRKPFSPSTCLYLLYHALHATSEESTPRYVKTSGSLPKVEKWWKGFFFLFSHLFLFFGFFSFYTSKNTTYKHRTKKLIW